MAKAYFFSTMETIFDKIIAGSIPSYKIYEDEYCLVILDINPIRKGHCLVISKKSVDTITKLDNKELCAIINAVAKIDSRLREKLGADAINIIVNDGKDAGQEVPHVHFHVVPRYSGDGSIGQKEKYDEGEIEKYFEKIKF